MTKQQNMIAVLNDVMSAFAKAHDHRWDDHYDPILGMHKALKFSTGAGHHFGGGAIIFEFQNEQEAKDSLYRYPWPILHGVQISKHGIPLLYPSLDVRIRTIDDIRKLPKLLPDMINRVLGANYVHTGD